jgi:hypothetical protein
VSALEGLPTLRHWTQTPASKSLLRHSHILSSETHFRCTRLTHRNLLWASLIDCLRIYRHTDLATQLYYFSQIDITSIRYAANEQAHNMHQRLNRYIRLLTLDGMPLCNQIRSSARLQNLIHVEHNFQISHGLVALAYATPSTKHLSTITTSALTVPRSVSHFEPSFARKARSHRSVNATLAARTLGRRLGS